MEGAVTPSKEERHSAFYIDRILDLDQENPGKSLKLHRPWTGEECCLYELTLRTNALCFLFEHSQLFESLIKLYDRFFTFALTLLFHTTHIYVGLFDEAGIGTLHLNLYFILPIFVKVFGLQIDLLNN